VTKLEEMRTERGKLVKQARDIVDLCDKEKRSITAEEDKQYEAIMADVDARAKDIAREERQQSAEADLRDHPGKGTPGDETRDDNTGKELRKQFAGFLRSGNVTGAELRALQADSDTAGGYLVAPQMFVNQIIKFVDDFCFIRGMATTYQMAKNESLGVPTLTANPADADWTAELLTGAADQSLKFGKRELRPHPVAKQILVSNKLLRSATIDIEAFVRDRMGYKFAITHEKAFLTGSGAEQPLGVFTASADGISTARDVATSNTSTAITADGLIEAKYSLKQAYWDKATWIFNRSVLKSIRKLKDGDGQYLWQPGITGGLPDRIIECPYKISEYAPATMTTGKYVGILGDFSYYWVVDALDLQIQRLVELYAATNQTGFVGRFETDGAPVLEEAFARVTLA